MSFPSIKTTRQLKSFVWVSRVALIEWFYCIPVDPHLFLKAWSLKDTIDTVDTHSVRQGASIGGEKYLST